MREIIEGKSSMTLQALRREQNYKSARVFVTVWVVKLQETLEVKKKMGDDSILMASDLILEDYYYLTGADLRLLFKRIVTGHYGVMYESLTIDKLMTYFSLYAKERWTEAERISLENHNQFKNKYNG
tara:strand:+ start:8556 stop:8936 length:381 start_codon:yes stop_codon:yes gene_type:complete